MSLLDSELHISRLFLNLNLFGVDISYTSSAHKPFIFLPVGDLAHGLMIQLSEPLTGRVWNLEDFEAHPALLVMLLFYFRMTTAASKGSITSIIMLLHFVVNVHVLI